MGGPGLGGLGEPMVALGQGLPMTDQDEGELVDISDLPLQLKMGMRFSTWMRFETWFKRYCTETHQAFSTAYSRSVDYANHRMAQSSMRYRSDLCYTYIMLTCVRSGTKQIKKGFEGERHRSHNKYMAYVLHYMF